LPLNKGTTCQGQGGFVYFLRLTLPHNLEARICGCFFYKRQRILLVINRTFYIFKHENVILKTKKFILTYKQIDVAEK